MKRALILLVLAVISFSSRAHDSGIREEDGFIYRDAATLTVNGKVKPGTGKPFERVDSGYDFKDKGLNTHARTSTGLSILFKTNSHSIKAVWKTSDAVPLVNMTMIAQKGLDLYIKKDGEWVFAGVGRPDRTNRTFRDHSGTIVEDMPDGEKECLLFLPMFDRLESMEIGVEEGSYIEPLDNPFRGKIIFIGSSIIHGASASRSGMIPTARFERATGLYTINMGFSGSCKLQESLAHYFDDVQADAFVMDICTNTIAEEIEQRFSKFMDILREAHPGTPFIMFQTERYETRNFSTILERTYAAKMELIERQARERMKLDRDLYFIEDAMYIGDDHNGTSDGVHPTDEGFSRMLGAFQNKIVRILRKYGVR